MKTTWMAGLCGLIILVGCAGNGDVVEQTYDNGIVGTAVLKPKANGGYQTISGDPIVAVDNGLTTADQLPYGDGGSGIRTMQDEAPPTGF